MQRSLASSVFAIVLVSPLCVVAQPPGGGRGHGAGGPGGGGPGGGSPMEMLSQMFDSADSDGDGLLSKEEVTAAMSNRRGGMQRVSQQGRGAQHGQGRPGGPGGRGAHDGPGAHGDPEGERGPGAHRGPQGERGPDDHAGRPSGGLGGSPPRPGQVLPDFVVEALNLNPRQQRQLAALQTEVDKRMAALLTDEQQAQLENTQHRGPHGEGGPHRDGGHHGEDATRHGGGEQGRDNGRPQRPE